MMCDTSVSLTRPVQQGACRGSLPHPQLRVHCDQSSPRPSATCERCPASLNRRVPPFGLHAAGGMLQTSHSCPPPLPSQRTVILLTHNPDTQSSLRMPPFCRAQLCAGRSPCSHSCRCVKARVRHVANPSNLVYGAVRKCQLCTRADRMPHLQSCASPPLPEQSV